MDRLGRVFFLVAVFLAIVATMLAFVVAFRQTPPPVTRHYVGLSWTEIDASGKTRLFSVTPTANGVDIAGDAWTCSTATASDGDEFSCGNHIFRYEQSAAVDRLISAGFEIRPGSKVSILGSGEKSTLLVRGPGVGARHLNVWALPSTHAPCSSRGPGLCVENVGASGTIAIYTDGGAESRHPRHGEVVTLDDGDELWLGYVLFRVTRSGQNVRLNVPMESRDSSWTGLRGDREWQGLEMPTWSFRREPTERQDFYPEAALTRLGVFGKGNLTAERVEVQQEETVQTLIDYELLCLDRVTTPTGTVPRLRWRDVSNPGCGGTALRADLRLAVPSSVERLFRVARTNPSINRLVTLTARRLEEDEFIDDPSELPLIFDYRFKATGNGLWRTPVTLLGIQPQVSFHRARRRVPAISSDPDIRFAAQSDSPRLEVAAIDASLASTPVTVGMQLVIAPGDDGSRREAFIGVGSPAAPAATSWVPARCVALNPASRCGPAVLTIGSAWFTGNRIAWVPQVAITPGGASASFTVQRTRARITATLTPRAGRVLHNGMAVTAPTPLRTGDALVIGGLTLTYACGDGVAAASRRSGGGFRRVYPAGRDALQLIGIGSRAGGIESSLDSQKSITLRKAWVENQTPLRLTVRADLQHIVARELNAAVDSLIVKAETANEPQRASRISGSAVLMNDVGDILAVGNAPTASMDDVAELEQTLLEAQRRHGEGRKAAERKVVNHAFLRALPVGSTQKIATSLAQFRENRWPESRATHACAKHVGGYWIQTPRNGPAQLAPLGGYDCHANHAGALGVGSLPAWHNAFRESCDAYFGLAALGLTPGHDWALQRPSGFGAVRAGISQRNSETAVVFDNGDPEAQLRPGNVEQPVAGDGNAYFETLLLLGFRFSSTFDGRGVSPQVVDEYDGIRYPTADRPWLPGLSPQAAFAYPTLAGFHSYSNAYGAGGVIRIAPRQVSFGTKTGNVVRDHHWMGYMMSAWGQTVAGNSLSIAASALPIVNRDGGMPQPRILVDAPSAAAAPVIFEPSALTHARSELRSALREVVQRGTAARYFRGSPVEPMTGGKTGTIQIEISEPESARAGQPESLRRALLHACGVIDSGATQRDWDVVLAEHRRLMPSDRSPWPAALPPFGFAEGSARCSAAFNPGLPRMVAPVATAVPLVVWDAFMTAESGEWRRRKVVSSAFVAVTLAPLITRPQTARGDAVGENWILGVIVDDHEPSPANPFTAKQVAVAILESLQRYLEVRTR